MAVRIGINGFGRIGRCVMRSLQKNPHFEVVLINDLTDSTTLAHLYTYDSVHGRAPGVVETRDGALVIDGRQVSVSAIGNPAEIPWGQHRVDVVLECTGRFTKGEECASHLRAGARKVLLSAPGKGVDKTLVLGVNHHEYKENEHHIISNGSCTTNCLAPLAKVLHDEFGIRKGLMTTIHSYTNDQRILDLPHSDLRRARAAALSMIPTSTGAAKAIAEVIPDLKGKLNGIAVRVPTPNVSLVDLTVELNVPTQADAVNNAFKKAADGPMKGILSVCYEPLVSCDFNGNPYSSIVDAEYTSVIGEHMVKVLSWYDNEWGFSQRLIQLAELVGTGKIS